MVVTLNEEKHGTGARTVNNWIERLLAIEWYNQEGQQQEGAVENVNQFMRTLGVNEYEVKWLSKNQVSGAIQRLTFERSNLWVILEKIPGQLRAKVNEVGNESLLEKVVDAVPEAIFHNAFERAFHTFGEEKTVQFLVGHAMYFSILICTAVLAEELKLFLPIVELLEAGYLPLGLEGNIFYLV
ncbi:hypothetical protein JDS92_06480 [Bacillus cereus group sp. N12]|uniref:hypothetical protein n=1 Tax=Bacillus cereus group sp. N12 TaxID=2794586 RepID=UPI0018F5C865|nr:hypothetical protein [Bacillus cereus group sp. N12]MBJ8075002.1 hypothetical protein [Bacillus cereus group sp. N12]